MCKRSKNKNQEFWVLIFVWFFVWLVGFVVVVVVTHFQHSIWERNKLYKLEFLHLQNERIKVDSQLGLFNPGILTCMSTVDEYSHLTSLYGKQYSHHQMCVIHTVHTKPM